MLSCGGAPFSVTFSIVFDFSFSVYRFRSIVFDEDNRASAAAAGSPDFGAEAAADFGGLALSSTIPRRVSFPETC